MIDIPHKWPGNKKLAQILAAMRVLGLREPSYVTVWDGDIRKLVYTPYSQLTTRKKKETYPSFKYFVRALIINQQEK